MKCDLKQLFLLIGVDGATHPFLFLIDYRELMIMSVDKGVLHEGRLLLASLYDSLYLVI